MLRFQVRRERAAKIQTLRPTQRASETDDFRYRFENRFARGPGTRLFASLSDPRHHGASAAAFERSRNCFTKMPLPCEPSTETFNKQFRKLKARGMSEEEAKQLKSTSK
jgi:hypothetical protein